MFKSCIPTRFFNLTTYLSTVQLHIITPPHILCLVTPLDVSFSTPSNRKWRLPFHPYLQERAILFGVLFICGLLVSRLQTMAFPHLLLTLDANYYSPCLLSVCFMYQVNITCQMYAQNTIICFSLAVWMNGTHEHLER